jgi:hypothetical protein
MARSVSALSSRRPENRKPQPPTPAGAFSFPHSITLSAQSSSACGNSRPSVFAVLRLMIISNLVGCRTGRSAGFAFTNARVVSDRTWTGVPVAARWPLRCFHMASRSARARARGGRHSGAEAASSSDPAAQFRGIDLQHRLARYQTVDPPSVSRRPPSRVEAEHRL